MLIQYKLKDNYISYLKQIESEIYFFKNYYNLYMNNKSIRMFNNIKNIFNHTIIPFKLEKDDIKINKLEKEVKALNYKLYSIYSLNNFSNKEKIKISDYEQHLINPPDKVYVSVSTSLDKPYFAAGGKGLYVYKIKEKEDKKHTITLVSKNKNLKFNIIRMIYLNNKKLILGGTQGIYLIKFNKDFNSYDIIFHKNENNEINDIIKINDNYFLSLENSKSIIKWVINKEENNINKLHDLNNFKFIYNICDINNKYFVYQNEEFIYIINHKTFKEHLKIKYYCQNHENGINKLTNNIFGSISYYSRQIDFFNVETGQKLFEIRGSGANELFRGFLRSKRSKEEIEIITLNEHLAYMPSYGYCSDYKLSANKGEIISKISDQWSDHIRHIFEMDDNTILVANQEKLYVLFYP